MELQQRKNKFNTQKLINIYYITMNTQREVFNKLFND